MVFHSSNSASTTLTIAPLIFAHLRPIHLVKVLTCCKSLYPAALLALYQTPDFSLAFGSPLTRFLAFLTSIRANNPHAQLVKHLDLSEVEEILYCTIPDDWLVVLLGNCLNLEKLTLAKVSFWPRSGSGGLERLPVRSKFRWLDVSDCPELNQATFQQLLRLSGDSLTVLKCDGSGMALSERNILSIAQECPELQVLTLSRIPGLNDTQLTTLIKFLRKSLKELDVSGARKLTNLTLNLLERHCLSLSSLKVNGCIGLDYLTMFDVLSKRLSLLVKTVEMTHLNTAGLDHISKVIWGDSLTHLVVDLSLVPLLLRLPIPGRLSRLALVGGEIPDWEQDKIRLRFQQKKNSLKISFLSESAH